MNNSAHPDQLSQSNQWIDSTPGRLLAGAVVVGEISPANEMLRIAAAVYAQRQGLDPAGVALAYGAATVAVEAPAAYLTAKLLHSNTGRNLIDKVNQKITKAGLQSALKTNVVTEAGIGMFGGASVAMLVKHRQDTERTVNKDKVYGLVMSLGIAAVSGLQGYAVAAGIDHPSMENIGLAGLVIGSSVAVIKKAKSRIGSKKNIEPEIFLADPNIEQYSNIVKSNSMGPQLEGFTPEDYLRVMDDPATTKVVLNKAGDSISWPLLTPIKNNSEYITGFFEKTKVGVGQVLYFSNPHELPSESEDDEISKILRDNLKQGAIIIYDEIDDSTTVNFISKYFPDNPSELEHHDFVDDKNGSPAAVLHFEGQLSVHSDTEPTSNNLRDAYKEVEAKYDIDPTRHRSTYILDVNQLMSDPVEKERVLKKLWNIYDGQFSKLVENHPSRQAQTESELRHMITDKNTMTVIHKEDSEEVSYAMFVGDIGACDWLNTDYYNNKYADEQILYFPGIVTDIEKKGHYSHLLLDLVGKVLTTANIDTRIVFQCTNISATYVPKIIEKAVEAASVRDANVQQFCKYKYRGVSLKVHK